MKTGVSNYRFSTLKCTPPVLMAIDENTPKPPLVKQRLGVLAGRWTSRT
jgi:hypothetical protein